MRNESSRALVERVQKSMEQPIALDIDISGLDIDYSVKTLILKCYEAKQPFALTMQEAENTVYFFPGHGCAVWCSYNDVTLNTFQDAQQFEKAIKAALIAHRKFMSVRQMEGSEQYREIVEQLKRVG